MDDQRSLIEQPAELADPVNATPCPRCNKRCELMAGCNVPRGDHELRYVVCWKCNLGRVVARGTSWLKLRG